MASYMKSLNKKERGKINKTVSTKVFKFGNNFRFKSEGEYTIPGIIAGRKVIIRTDVVKSEIPLLLSRSAMKKAGVRLDLQDGKVNIFGQDIDLKLTESGHCCIELEIGKSIPRETRSREIVTENNALGYRQAEREILYGESRKTTPVDKSSARHLGDVLLKGEGTRSHSRNESRKDGLSTGYGDFLGGKLRVSYGQGAVLKTHIEGQRFTSKGDDNDWGVEDNNQSKRASYKYSVKDENTDREYKTRGVTGTQPNSRVFRSKMKHGNSQDICRKKNGRDSRKMLVDWRRRILYNGRNVMLPKSRDSMNSYSRKTEEWSDKRWL